MIYWFVESNENTFIVNRRYLRFELCCHLKNESILYYIKNKLGFGLIRHIKFLDGIITEFSVQNNITNLLILVKIFNGNLRCTMKKKNFYIFYQKLKTKLKKLDLLHYLPEYEDKIVNVSLLNSWLLGYLDGRVLFHGRWHKSKKLKEGKELYLSCIFWHLDRNLLYNIKEILNSNGKIEEKFKWNLPFFRLVIDNIDEKNKIANYLKIFKLKSKKKKRYKYWFFLLNLENNYIKTGIQDFDLMEKYLTKLNSTIDEGELNKI